MGGGGSNSSPPVDVAPGGGTFPVNSMGEAYNPAWGQPDYSGLGKAFSSAGSQYAQGMAAGANHNYMTGATIPSQQTYGNGNLPDTLIPSVQDLKQNSKDDLAQALQRLLASGGAQSSKLRQAWDWNFRSSGMPTELLQPNFTPYMGLV
jgi:hypothetical protein